jgi:hypothetical protein
LFDPKLLDPKSGKGCQELWRSIWEADPFRHGWPPTLPVPTDFALQVCKFVKGAAQMIPDYLFAGTDDPVQFRDWSGLPRPESKPDFPLG